jgi:hypothetical protein
MKLSLCINGDARRTLVKRAQIVFLTNYCILNIATELLFTSGSKITPASSHLLIRNTMYIRIAFLSA